MFRLYAETGLNVWLNNTLVDDKLPLHSKCPVPVRAPLHVHAPPNVTPTAPLAATKKKALIPTSSRTRMHIAAKRHKRHIERDLLRNLFILHCLAL